MKNFKPEAYISIGKNRQKIYASNTVYLKNGQEFTFEFFNSTEDNIMATISLNGKQISNKGIVLRPGQRGWIERYIDEDRKFLFETYEVGSSKAVKKAIEKNGDVQIRFYRERQRPHFLDWGGVHVNDNTITYKHFDGSTITYDQTLTAGNSTTLDSCNYIGNVLHSTGESVRASTTASAPQKKLKKSVETGRVEKGDVSDQRFTYVDMNFESWASHIVNYKILPISQKKNYLDEIKLKCQKCGMKLKKNWNVCPVCGTEINEQCTCPNCYADVQPTWKVCPMCGTKI